MKINGRRGAMLGACAAASVTVTVMVAVRSGGASAGCAADVVAGVADSAPALASGTLTTAAAGKALVTIGEGGERVAYLHGAPPGAVVRHVAARAGSGVAYVEDRAGPDALVLVSTGGVTRREPGGEVTHPAWGDDGSVAYAVDLAQIEVLGPDGTVRSFPPPDGAVGVFAPVPLRSGSLLALVEEPVAGADTHDDTLNNVWRLDAETGSWTRLSSFTVDADHWSILRTPVRDGGEVLLVRERGRSTATAPSSFELWRTDGENLSMVRGLGGEMFLAGVTGDGLLWNVERDGEWRLFVEAPEGLRPLGCGAVMVDPFADPDRGGDDGDEADPAGAAALVPTAPAAMGIVVGDFLSLDEAQRVALTIPGSVVVDAADAPSAVAPGLYAVAVTLPDGADLDESLAGFRTAHPHLAERSWISSLNG